MIIDDSMKKRNSIKESLEKIVDDPWILEFDNYISSMRYLKENSHKVDLLILDWNFPVRPNEEVERGMGNSVLARVPYLAKRIPVVLCSDAEINYEDYQDYVLGTIHYDSSVEQTDQWRNLLQMEKKNKLLEKKMSN